MFGSEVIDAAIGLFLVYFLFSLLCSAINELVVGHLGSLRARTLEIAIQRMLQDKQVADDLFNQPLIRGLSNDNGVKPSYISPQTFIDGLLALVDHRANQGRSLSDNPKQSTAPGETAQSEIGRLVAAVGAVRNAETPAVSKASTELETLLKAVNRIESPDTAAVLRSLLRGSTSMDEARKRLEQWFDEAMDRASGWYKKKIHWFVGLWSLIVAVAFNVDTFAIAQALLNNPALRASMVAAAETAVQQSAAAPTNTTSRQTIEMIDKRIQDLELPIGWICRTNAATMKDGSTKAGWRWLRVGETPLSKIAGLLVTAAALSLGAPFWFDLLNRFMNLRAAGKKPEPRKESDTE